MRVRFIKMTHILQLTSIYLARRFSLFLLVRLTRKSVVYIFQFCWLLYWKKRTIFYVFSFRSHLRLIFDSSAALFLHREQPLRVNFKSELIKRRFPGTDLHGLLSNGRELCTLLTILTMLETENSYAGFRADLCRRTISQVSLEIFPSKYSRGVSFDGDEEDTWNFPKNRPASFTFSP